MLEGPEERDRERGGGVKGGCKYNFLAQISHKSQLPTKILPQIPFLAPTFNDQNPFPVPTFDSQNPFPLPNFYDQKPFPRRKSHFSSEKGQLSLRSQLTRSAPSYHLPRFDCFLSCLLSITKATKR